jgi:RNA polymerase sigma-70 factor (ECF subfamily)
VVLHDALERAFRRLTPEHRAVVVLTHVDDLSMQDTAAALGIPVGTAKSRLHHALRALRAALDADARLPVRSAGDSA